MNLKDIPDIDSAKYSETIPIKVTPEMKKQWDDLRRVHKKQNAEWGRKILEEGFKKLESSKTKAS